MNEPYTSNTELCKGPAILLSIKPKYAEQIFSGNKRIELRRSWPIKKPISRIIVYASAPAKSLVGVVSIKQVLEQPLEALWQLAQVYGGYVAYSELMTYLQGKNKAYGILLDQIEPAEKTVDPRSVFSNFAAPQFFTYLALDEYLACRKAMFPSILG